VDIFVARQPIFCGRSDLYGYELLYRGSALATAAAGLSSNHMSSTVIMHALVDLGMPRITGGKRGFLNFTREMLVNDFWELFDRDGVVIEVLETVEPDEEVIAACVRLRDAGYMLALDDFVDKAEYRPLLELAQVVKIDVLNRTPHDIEREVQPFRAFDAVLLAERIEDEAIFTACRNIGFEYFQGYFFSRPEMVAGREMPADQIAILRLISLVRDIGTNEMALEQAFRADVGLTYKLLRIVNSAAVGGRGVESIRHAIQLVGRAALARWLGLIMISSLGRDSGPNRELSEIALVRARICEQLASANESAAASGARFMVGLFSLLDHLMAKPMGEIVAEVDLAPEVKQALTDRTGPYARPLELLEAYEEGNWSVAERACAELGIPRDRLAEMYVDGLQWARDQLTLAIT
jgi:c-di-GMP phosphodiesterase